MRCERGEDGFSVLEIAVSMTVMLVIATMGFGATSTFLKVQASAIATSQSNSAAAQAHDELRQEIISANVVYDPSKEVGVNGVNYAGTNPDGTNIPAGWSLRVYTQYGASPMCVQWRVLDTGAMQVRSWSNQWQTNNQVHPWTTLITGVVNPPGSVPFVLDSGAAYGGGGSGNSRLLDVQLMVIAQSRNQAPVPLSTSIAARDAEYYPTNAGNCWPIPAP